jgi:hypothetical protein
MASTFQNTHFNPAQGGALNISQMEEGLAREMAKLKMADERSLRE